MTIYSDNNFISGNTVTTNGTGFLLSGTSAKNTLTNNTVQSNTLGIYLDTGGNKIYRNNFINNQEQGWQYLYNSFTLPSKEDPRGATGGNYWSDFDTALEGCTDLNNDAFCDAAYIKSRGIRDNLPWKKPNAWIGWTCPGVCVANSLQLAQEPLSQTLPSMVNTIENNWPRPALPPLT